MPVPCRPSTLRGRSQLLQLDREGNRIFQLVQGHLGCESEKKKRKKKKKKKKKTSLDCLFVCLFFYEEFFFSFFFFRFCKYMANKHWCFRGLGLDKVMLGLGYLDNFLVGTQVHWLGGYIPFSFFSFLFLPSRRCGFIVGSSSYLMGWLEGCFWPA